MESNDNLNTSMGYRDTQCGAAIIDEETKVKHSKLSERTEEVISDPAGKLSVKLRQDNCDIAYPPIIQSGGDYDLKVGPASHACAAPWAAVTATAQQNRWGRGTQVDILGHSKRHRPAGNFTAQHEFGMYANCADQRAQQRQGAVL